MVSKENQYQERRGRRGAHLGCYVADVEQAAGPMEEPTTAHLDEPIYGWNAAQEGQDNVELTSRKKGRKQVPEIKTCS